MADWNIECIRTGMQPHAFMHPPYQTTRTPRPGLDEDLSAPVHSLSLEVSIKADVRRLVQALSFPEYVEAWIAFPGEMPGCSTVATRDQNDYAIEHYCSGRQSVLISGRYQASRRHKVAFSWRVDGDFSVPETMVEIRLHGDFERTTVEFRQTGFASRHDCAWHRALWTGSMARLAALYGTSDLSKNRGGSRQANIA
ncbi:MAG: hypothetical protein C5B46_01800 [Proteobacteria bacterium]|nr:MAG: hypothetical protein C5B46_01800 [Pseudomonadota bacterium]